MADDYLERTGAKDKIKTYIEKAKEWFNRWVKEIKPD